MRPLPPLLVLLVGLLMAVPQAWAGKKLQMDPGFRVMDIVDILPSSDGLSALVLLADPKTGVMLPITVGGTEALAIALRHDRRRFERPLTHDLLDGVIEAVGAEVHTVQIDDLADGVFVATVGMKRGRKDFTLDARASDAIALALGNHLDLLVSDKIVELVGVTQDDLLESDPEPQLAPTVGIY